MDGFFRVKPQQDAEQTAEKGHGWLFPREEWAI
jgi:hypothetical protein